MFSILSQMQKKNCKKKKNSELMIQRLLGTKTSSFIFKGSDIFVQQIQTSIKSTNRDNRVRLKDALETCSTFTRQFFSVSTSNKGVSKPNLDCFTRSSLQILVQILKFFFRFQDLKLNPLSKTCHKSGTKKRISTEHATQT